MNYKYGSIQLKKITEKKIKNVKMLTMTCKVGEKKAQLIMNVKDTTSVDDSWNKNINNFDINQESSGMFSIHLYLIKN